MNNNLKKYRKMLKLSQQDLAEQLFITRQTIINIENRKHDPSLSLAFKLAKMFNCTLEQLFSSNTYPQKDNNKDAVSWESHGD